MRRNREISSQRLEEQTSHRQTGPKSHPASETAGLGFEISPLPGFLGFLLLSRIEVETSAVEVDVRDKSSQRANLLPGRRDDVHEAAEASGMVLAALVRRPHGPVLRRFGVATPSANGFEPKNLAAADSAPWAPFYLSSLSECWKPNRRSGRVTDGSRCFGQLGLFVQGTIALWGHTLPEARLKRPPPRFHRPYGQKTHAASR